MYNKYPSEINQSNILEHPRRMMERTPPKTKVATTTEIPTRQSSSPPIVTNRPAPTRLPQDDMSDSEHQYDEPITESMSNPQHTQHPTFKSSYNSSPSNPYLLLSDPISTNSTHAHTQTINGVRTRSDKFSKCWVAKTNSNAGFVDRYARWNA
eukprot:GHVP01055635.1.p1 GENE.GHVP01055635.1~~GHVP01055635.1.p1  ORF type:complete len:153 (-),score=9.86 GHVP01055635.1:192-650(-)